VNPAHAPDPARNADTHAAFVAACVVAAATGLAPEALFRGTRGGADEALARQIMLDVLRVIIDDNSLVRLARAADRHRSTVSHAIEEIERAREGDERFDAYVAMLTRVAGDLVGLSRFTIGEIEAGIAAAKQRGGAIEDEDLHEDDQNE